MIPFCRRDSEKLIGKIKTAEKTLQTIIKTSVFILSTVGESFQRFYEAEHQGYICISKIILISV